ncbi:carbohydrate ABC transporter permease [Paenibacillus sp. IB182496]|uniref:Carbohydrate ABC transporter permease n=1 Tax=Paenibacillus sabuli TaxID=2772509 RepID=A0A927BUJ4_9BACL|nr:carbohydrate ABC transporter permease [Paenibacillus sabuli]MBD2847091.1 carbohydrate ABC transporter permease [Paenibacillus sabuli]
MITKSRGEKFFDVLLYVVLACSVVMIFYPFLHVLSISFSDRGEALRAGFHFYPRSVSLEAYAQILDATSLWRAYGNTLFRMVLGTAAALTVTILAAYPLSKSYFPLKRMFLLLILFTMLFEGGIIPTYLLLKELDILNTRGVYIVLHMANAFHVLVMITFFRSIPRELEEAARIDGASELKTLYRVILPLTIPVVATIGLWNLVAHLNMFMDNLLYVTDRSKFVLQQILQEILIEDRQDSFADIALSEEPPTPESLKMASIIVSITPMLLLYPFMLRYFEKGVMVGSVKG